MAGMVQVTLRLSTPEQTVSMYVGPGQESKMPPGCFVSVALDGQNWCQGMIAPEQAEALVDWIDSVKLDESAPWKAADVGQFDVQDARAWLARETGRLRREVQKALSDAVDALAERKATFDRWSARP